MADFKFKVAIMGNTVVNIFGSIKFTTSVINSRTKFTTNLTCITEVIVVAVTISIVTIIHLVTIEYLVANPTAAATK